MHWKRALTRLFALVAVVAALAACGGGGNTSAQSVPTSKATRVLGIAADRTLGSLERGDVDAARAWLLVREFRH